MSVASLRVVDRSGPAASLLDPTRLRILRALEHPDSAAGLARRLGVPRQMVGDVLGKSSGASFILERKLGALVTRDYRPGFFVDLARKDLGLALALAREAESRVALAAQAIIVARQPAGQADRRLADDVVAAIRAAGK